VCLFARAGEWLEREAGDKAMKEKETTPEKIIVIDIKLTRGLVVAFSCVLVAVAVLTCLTLTGERAAASETEIAEAASSTGLR
jgi:hypothetical protein